MEHVRGLVLDGDKVIAKDVEITAVVDPRANSKRWYGCFIVSDQWSPEITGPLTLEFEDGRSGQVVVRRTKSSTPEQTTVFFDGTTALG